MAPGSRGAVLAPIGEGPYAQVLKARSGIGDLALKIQKETGPDPNPEVEARWKREHQALARFGGEEPGLLGIEPIPGFEEEHEAPRFEPLFLCRERALLFHLPCPRSLRTHVLADCRDDEVLAAHGLPIWSGSKKRFLWSTAYGADDPVFYTRKHQGGPGPVKDFVGLVRDLRNVVDRGPDEEPIPAELLDSLEKDFPCMTCDQRAACYPRPESKEQGLAEVRLQPVSMYEFHAWPLALCALHFDEAADLLSGLDLAELSRIHGRDWKSPAVRRMKEAALAKGAPGTPLEALAAKLDIFAQAVQSAHRLHEMSGQPHLGLAPHHILVQPEEGQTPLVRLAAPDAPRRLGALRLPPPDPVPPYAAPPMLDTRFGHEYPVRIHIQKVWSGTGDTFFSADVRGDGLPLNLVGEDDLLLLTFKADGWEGVEILGNRIEADGGGDAGGLSLVTTPKDLDVTQVNDLKEAKGRSPLFGSIRIHRDFGIPFDIHALGMLAFRTFLTNRSQSFERVVEELVLPVSSSLSLFAATRPDAESEEFDSSLREFLGQAPVDGLSGPEHVWHEPKTADTARVPTDAWYELLAVAFRAVTLIPGFSYLVSDREDPEDDPGDATLAMLQDLEAVSEKVAAAIVSDISSEVEADEEVLAAKPLSDTDLRSITGEVSAELEAEVDRLREELEKSEKARQAMEHIWAAMYESVVGVKDTGRAPADAEDGRVTLLTTTASESIECITQVFKGVARFGGDELGENVPRIRLLIQDALRESKGGKEDAASKAKKIRRQMKALRMFLFATVQTFLEAHTSSTKDGTKSLLDLLEKALFEPVTKGRKSRPPDMEEIQRRFAKLKAQMPEKHQRLFQPFFQKYVKDKLSMLR